MRLSLAFNLSVNPWIEFAAPPCHGKVRACLLLLAQLTFKLESVRFQGVVRAGQVLQVRLALGDGGLRVLRLLLRRRQPLLEVPDRTCAVANLLYVLPLCQSKRLQKEVV